MILKLSEDSLVFTAGKYVGKKVEEVAVKDPTYLAWVYEKAVLDLSDSDFYKLEDVLKAHRIKPFNAD